MRINYWTTACLEPKFEAVSKEVVELAQAFPGSRVLAVSPHLRFKVMRGALGLHTSMYPLLRALIPLWERRGAVNHVYGELTPWLFFRALRARPIVLTVASEKGTPIVEFLRRCAVIAVQTRAMQQQLSKFDLDARNIRVIYPGADLSRFKPRSSQPDRQRPRILLATFPRAEDELEGRGVKFLIEAARAHPGMDFHFIARPWGTGDTALKAVQALVAREGLLNIRISQGVQERMEDLYAAHDFTVIPYTKPDGGKECPLSMVEGLACGLPVLISSASPFASFVDEQDCGQVFDPTPKSFGEAIDRALRSYEQLRDNATRCARAFFDRDRTRSAYAEIYAGLVK